MIKSVFELIERNPRLTGCLSYHGISDYVFEIKHGDEFVCSAQSCDINLVAAEAYIAVTDWLNENRGGY